ncbi:stage V sporulation protein SpoVABEA [Thermincola ferriacetica]
MKKQTRKVIIVTDGDMVAKRTVEIAARNVGARCISLSAGNPTPISGRQAVELIKLTPHDPVVLMVDDRGHTGFGKGEQVLDYVVRHPEIDVLGVVAVASNTSGIQGTRVDKSITRDGVIVDGPVDKYGQPEPANHKYLEGDTVSVLNSLDVKVIIGLGDIGKMDMADDISNGAPLTTKALQEVINRSGYKNGRNDGSKDPGK